jgi:hypothetical protein
MTRKFAVSVPDDLFETAEEERALAALTRSAMVQRALAAWVRARVEERLDEQYAEAYRRQPETPEEIAEMEAWSKVGLQTWDDDPWDESMVVWPEDVERPSRVAEVDADRRGYGANPETPEEIAESDAAAMKLFAAEEPWE